jgi:hypothetical protein
MARLLFWMVRFASEKARELGLRFDVTLASGRPTADQPSL